MLCTTQEPHLTGERIKIRFVGEDPITLNLACYRPCDQEAILNEVVATITVAGKTNDITAYHCQKHATTNKPE